MPEGTRFGIVPAHADEYFSDRNFAIVEGLRGVSERTGVPMVRLALGWVLRQPHIDGALIGARHEGHIDNAADAEADPLDSSLAAELDALSALE